MTDTKSMVHKIQKSSKWDFIKIKIFCSAKCPANSMKRQPVYWENIYTNYSPEKEIGSRIYKEFLKFNPLKKTKSN